ncbi:putative ubiquionol cytochrome c reductase hinge protein [Phaeoacremonium minimum UCRPA7]|uniref:Cytochrome b-c1 complex subunit 6, mitochondrial n=1 Tax=Phaeoacremonium minimum (strain UCR-PA7) TaxID=1286976 RepID=R8BKP8_PHAM7|nr:putative ubiquionol cytochrome c reductase hinge protein [Phaeoacremonium minimum UCRPA7]EON99782.1 putative ubiquionol cytochrome c reductase hinge protein [Phaeoacremonium minimum UCRPA7]
MGIWEAITDLVEAAAPWSVAEAEAPAEEPQEESSDDSKDEEATEQSDDAEDAEEGGDDEEEEEEDEDEEEIVDPKEKLEEECKESKQCAPAKHHFDECVERVTNAEGEDGPKEDCVEEFFHLAHCATQCAAPKLWSQLK